MSKTQTPDSTDETEIGFEQAIPLEQIHPPNRSDKLHPYEDEEIVQGDSPFEDLSEAVSDDSNNENDTGDWDEFRVSVGTQPKKPLEVTPDGDGGYEIIDGDRRYRALKENGAETVACFIVTDNETQVSESEKTIRMVTANEFRKDSNKKQRSRHTARIVAPWLLPPGERYQDVREMDQTGFAERVGKSQQTISRWLEPVKDNNQLRSVLDDISSTRKYSKEDVEQIDRIVDLLRHGGDAGNVVVPIRQTAFVAEELGEMEGVSISEIENVAEKAVEGGWDQTRFLEYLKENYAYDEMERQSREKDEGDGIEAGMMGSGEDPYEEEEFEDTTGVSVDDIKVDDEEAEDTLDLATPEIDVDWSELVDEEDLPGEKSLAEYESNRMMSQTIEDEAAVGVNLLAALTGKSKRDVFKQVVEPAAVDRIHAILSDEE